ncbi:NAD(P)-dependent oxidoreductase [Geobacter sp. DSM 9736]|uniref:NAD(P)-dependent oxidoreductase n=1 Tax=Geobacter sp. DSM 9736 TaxID=1277350 RepID=UPI000B513474|nr:NAD(P)-dependent oxidoreductase [Geobacter sp. DSM 9736]SNB46771.1 2-hydroxy-3-oxopropionate reductase [Geobacter sp. DSM 9736]
MQKFGFIGLGIMGQAMAANLLKAGFSVTVWNRSLEKAAPLAASGAVLAETPQAVVESCPITFAMLADPAAAETVCFGKYGVLDGMGEGRGYVDMSTVDPSTARRIAAAVKARGGRYLEAPVSGSKKPAEEGTLVILAAGDRSLFTEAEPAFRVMGKKALHLGEVGNGAAMKLVVNMIMGGMMGIFCEGLALGEKAGLAHRDILDVLGAGAVANPMFALKGELIGKGEFSPAFPLKHMQKDLRLAIALGDSLDQPLHNAASANESFKKAKLAGLGDADFSAVYQTISS